MPPYIIPILIIAAVISIVILFGVPALARFFYPDDSPMPDAAIPAVTADTPHSDAAETYRVAFRSTDAPFESAHDYALGVVYEAGVKAGRQTEVTA
tara:strand:- start:27320 stop:27607 length:288 start_codon:yes stop_codon:yes gene_type:complete